ncbi:MAG: 30S ribosomal protein S20 [Deltaproteobacteria bacterium]|nr:30S ribosomal protein S20 [Deltaproteobacteria bacterium]
MAEAAKKKGKLQKGRHRSAIKRARQAAKRHRRNVKYVVTLRRAMKAVRAAVAGKDRSKAVAALQTAIPVIDKTASKGIIPKRRAARYVSRLTRAVNQLAA